MRGVLFEVESVDKGWLLQIEHVALAFVANQETVFAAHCKALRGTFDFHFLGHNVGDVANLLRLIIDIVRFPKLFA